MIVVVTGVAAAGKSTLGRALARSLGWEYVEGDERHSAANRRKMAGGTPLSEADRAPWLDALGEAIRRRAERGDSAVVSCSCLRRDHRDRLRGTGVRFVHLEIDPATARERLEEREGHFFGSGLAESQFEAWEAPVSGVRLDARKPVDDLVREARAALGIDEA